jgi:hypothetical protein
MSTLITDMEQITPGWLTEALRRQGCLDQGKVVAVEKAPTTTQTSVVSHLEITYSDDAPESAPPRLFFKMSKPDFRSNMYVSHGKEVTFYNTLVLNMEDPPVVRCYDAVYSEETDQAHLLLEDLSGTHLQSNFLPPLMTQCEQAIDSLAKIHAFCWENPQLGKEIGTFLNVQLFIRAFEMSFPGFVDFLGDRLFASERQVYEKVLASLAVLWERYLQHRFAEGRALTLVHTDLHFGNFLFPKDSDGKLCIIDWESWSVYIGAHDVAYAIALSWYPRRRRVLEKDLVRRYHDGLLSHGVENYSWDDCWQDYRLSVIVNLFSPVLRYAMFDESKEGWWWSDLERSLLAFEDLNCAELLD